MDINVEDVCRENGSLLPVAIELQKVAGEAGTVYTPYDTTELWQLTKEIISSLDCGAFTSPFCPRRPVVNPGLRQPQVPVVSTSCH